MSSGRDSVGKPIATGLPAPATRASVVSRRAPRKYENSAYLTNVNVFAYSKEQVGTPCPGKLAPVTRTQRIRQSQTASPPH